MTAYGRVRPYLRPHAARFFYACLAMVLVAAFNGGSVLLLKPIVDRVFIAKDLDMLWLAVIGVPLLVALKTCASYVQNYLMSWIGQTVTQKIREDLFRHLHELSLEFYDRHRAGEILSRVTSDLTMVQSALTSVPLYLIRDTMTVIALVASLFYLDWRFALLSLLAMPLAFTTLFILSRKMRDASLQSQLMMDRLCDRFEESIRGMPVIKAFNYEEGAIEKFIDENDSFFVPMMRYLRATALAAPLTELCASVIVAFIIYFGGREVIQGHMTPGAFFAFLGAFLAAYAPLKNLARSNSELQRALASGERIFELLEERPGAAMRIGGGEFAGLSEGIRLSDVGFRYPGTAEAALSGLTLSIRKGEKVALVGPSGSGKSTLIRLLMGLLEPTQGKIYFDGIDSADLSPRSLRSKIGLVTQDTLLFNDTVFGNIALGRRVVTLGEVERACRIAGLERFIARLPQGYQTLLGERGLSLPPGFRQKLAMARIAVKDPPILILDEVAASLDSADEGELVRALEILVEGRTVITVAHKLRVAAKANRIFVLDAGAVAETGEHHALLAQNGLYRRLFDLEQSEPAGRP
ncbi:MAG: ABC transporter ATP-binding protein [Elusimicrobiota bacterium]